MDSQGHDDAVGAILLFEVGEVLRVADRCLRIFVVCYDDDLVRCQQSPRCEMEQDVPICKTSSKAC